MAKKFAENQKQAQGRENKQKVLEHKKKQLQELKQKKDDEAWQLGAKDTSKQEAERLKKEEKRAKKKERENLLLEEEGAAGSGPSTGFRHSPRTAGAPIRRDPLPQNGMVYSASNLNDALELMETVTSSGASIASSVERHPERRVKAAFATFEEKELPLLRVEYPSLRLSQLQGILWKKFAKSSENPMNQPHVSYEATPDEVRELASKIQQTKLDSFRSNY